MADNVADQAITTDDVTEKPPDVIDLETTPEFKSWKQDKLKQTLAYLHDNWNMKEITLEKLVMTPDFVFPDRENRKSYGSVSSGQGYHINGKTAINPATGKEMRYTIWRKIDPPAPAPETANVDAEGITDT